MSNEKHPDIIKVFLNMLPAPAAPHTQLREDRSACTVTKVTELGPSNLSSLSIGKADIS
jgi:hypothetical protein